MPLPTTKPIHKKELTIEGGGGYINKALKGGGAKASRPELKREARRT